MHSFSKLRLFLCYRHLVHNFTYFHSRGTFFYVCRVVDLMKTAKLNSYISFNDFQEANTYLYIVHWKYGRNMTLMELVSDRTLVTNA